MFRFFLDILRNLVAGDDLRALERYRMACHLVHRWNGNLPNSAESASWISQVGEGQRGADISEFRDALVIGEADRSVALVA